MRKSLKLNAVLNMLRSSLSLIFPFITFPYVSRVLGSNEFGKYSFSASVISYFSLFAAYGISTYAIREAAPIRENKEKISQLASKLFSFNIYTSILAYIVIFLLTATNSRFEPYRPLIMIQSISILLTTVGMDWINTVYEDFLYITVRFIIIQFVSLFAIFIFVRSPSDTLQYCLILVMASYGGNLVNIIYVRKYVKIKFHLNPKMLHCIIPLTMIFINSLAVTIYVNSDVVMLGLLQGSYQVGIYSFSSKIYNIAKHCIYALVVAAIPRLAYLKVNDGAQYLNYLNKITSALALVLIPCSFALFLLAKSIIIVVGGPEYLQGVLSLRILSIALIFALISSVYTNCILIINKLEKYVLISTLTAAFVNVAANFIIIPVYSAAGAAITTVIAEGINLIIQRLFISKKMDLKIKINTNNVVCILGGAIITVLICLLANHLFRGDEIRISIIRIIFSVIITISSYLMLLISLKNDFALGVIKELKYRFQK